MLFRREYLTRNYTWKSGEAVLFSESEATRRTFDPFNGYQVLFIINLFASSQPLFTIEDGRKIEEDIHMRLPLQNQSEISVFAILKERKTSVDQKKRGYIHYSSSDSPNTHRGPASADEKE